MYRFLLTRQWVALTLLGLLLIPVMIKLGFWQYHRHEDRVARNDQVAAALAAPAVPVDRLTGVGEGPAKQAKFRTVTAEGRYDTAHEVLVRHRTGPDEQTIGYFVVTPLVRADGTAVLVNRGWFEGDGDQTKQQEAPAPPSGEVEVTGRVMPDETTEASGIRDTKGLPDGQVMLINSGQRAADLEGPLLGGYVQLEKSTPTGGSGQPEVLPEPDHSGIGPHMAYAIQWWLFTGAVPVGWVVLLRRELKEQAAPGTGTTAEASPPPEADGPAPQPAQESAR
ncbi:SURF1 family protein [Streptomyces sulphureus]|uniref:SURF1 family cytochrome oxidase biogenesis protein n=1 Tax=Streptomyces sulphureus TaxID=47758 RepID=UPI0003674923|nr:SURF1 family protein [Streptomyces sulphureus]